MRSQRNSLGAAAASAVLFAMVTSTASGEVIRHVVPLAAQGAEGNDGFEPVGIAGHLQLLVPASEFAGLPPGPLRIVAFNHRADADLTDNRDWTWPDVQVTFSTTAKSSLTEVYEDNFGFSRHVAHVGDLVFRILGKGPPQGPKDVADGPRLQSPYDFDPVAGSLLLDVVFFTNNPDPSPKIDLLHSSPNAHTMFGALDAEAGSTANLSTVLQFEFERRPSGGDTNDDGKVDISDLNNVRNNFGGVGLGDADKDGDVDIEDLNAVRNNFGAGGQSVPEPSACALAMVLGCVGLFGAARRGVPHLLADDQRMWCFVGHPRQAPQK